MYSIIAADCLKKKIKTVFSPTVSQMQGSLANCHLIKAMHWLILYGIEKKITKLNASECIQNWPRAILITTENKIYLFQFHDNKLAAF